MTGPEAVDRPRAATLRALIQPLRLRRRYKKVSPGAPEGGYVGLQAGDYYILSLKGHTDLDFSDGHTETKFAIVLRDMGPTETQVPVVMAGSFRSSNEADRRAAESDDHVLLDGSMGLGSSQRYFDNKRILIDCTKVHSFGRHRFENRSRVGGKNRGRRCKGNVEPVYMNAIRQAVRIGLELDVTASVE